MNKLFCVLVFFCCLSAAFAITFDVCGSPTAEIGTVEVSGCTDTDDVCPFKKNTYVNMTADFTAAVLDNDANVKITGYVGGVPFPFKIDPSDACGNYNIQCPINPSSQNEIQLQMLIRSAYPTIGVKIKFQLIGDNDNDIICFEFKAHIVN